MGLQSPAPKRRLGRYVFRRLAALSIGVVLSLVLFEAILWILFAFFQPDSLAGSRLAEQLRPAPGERRILCIGDSNTYGIGLEADESYPGRLQRYLDRSEGNPWRVINLGYPGQNTAQMRGRLAENLDAYDPEIVIFWGGVNNAWSPAMGHLWDHPDDEPADADSSVFARLVRKSRACKSLRMMALNLMVEGGEPPAPSEHPQTRPGDDAVPGIGGARRGEGLGKIQTVDSKVDRVAFEEGEVQSHILTDLRRVQALCEGRALILVAYHSDYPTVEPKVNTPIRAYAQEHSVPLVDLREDFLPFIDSLGRNRLLERKGWHATAVGNMEVARVMLSRLIELGLLDQEPEWLEIDTLEQVFERPFLELTAYKVKFAELEIADGADWMYRCTLEYLTRVPGQQALQATEVPAEWIAELEGQKPRAYSGRLDNSGHKRIKLWLPKPPREVGCVGWRIRLGCGATLEDLDPLRVSDPVDILF